MADIKDNETRSSVVKFEAPSVVEMSKQKLDGTVKKKRRRGKSKRKITKPYLKLSWQERRKNDKTKRINRFRKVVVAKTQAPFNNNQFLMEIHKPEPENSFQILRTPSARTRDSSFSVDSEDNYFFSLPEDEEEYLTKEFSSVYEDAQSERLSNMSKNELIEEYLLLEAKYENLLKRTERSRPRCDDKDIAYTDHETSISDRESMVTDRNISATTLESNSSDAQAVNDMVLRMKEQENQINELQIANEKLRIENEHLRKKSQSSSSEDSESDSSSTSVSCSSSSRSESPVNDSVIDNNITEQNDMNLNGEVESSEVINGFHSPGESTAHNGI